MVSILEKHWKSAKDLREALKRLSRSGRLTKWLAGLDPRSARWLVRHEWPVFAGEAQIPPRRDWRTWLMQGGRGAGKTRAGAQWVRALALGDPHFPGDAAGRIALVAESLKDARDVMIEGESGLLAIHDKRERPQWNPSLRRLTWDNGTIAQIYSASDPESLRGAQFGAAWADELAKWPYLQETWDMLQFCMRLGSDPRRVATTTPKPLPLLRKLRKDSDTALTQASSFTNRAHLAPGFLEYLTGRYGGTRLGRQELDGEIIDDREDALWKRAQLEACRRTPPEALKRIIIAVDPPATSAKSGAACGIIAAGRDESGHCYILADRTVENAVPDQWTRAVAGLYHDLDADLVVAEVNQGGEMVRKCMETADPTIPVQDVHATRGKYVRAEPVSLYYQRGRVFHAHPFPELEDQMCAFGPDGRSHGVSPDRLDAMVWAVHFLLAQSDREPRIHFV